MVMPTAHNGFNMVQFHALLPKQQETMMKSRFNVYLDGKLVTEVTAEDLIAAKTKLYGKFSVK